jgi:hypothetical protein
MDSFLIGVCSICNRRKGGNGKVIDHSMCKYPLRKSSARKKNSAYKSEKRIAGFLKSINAD